MLVYSHYTICLCFIQVAAAQLHSKNSVNGDVFVSNNAYYAMVDTLIGISTDKSRSYKLDFNNLCSPSVGAGVQAGCAMFAVNFNGGNDRSISDYFYQVQLFSLRVLKYSVSSLVKNVVWIDDLVKYIFIR